MPCSAVDFAFHRRRLALVVAALSLPGCEALDAAPTPVAAPYVLTASGRLDSASEARTLVAEQDGIITEMLVERDAPVMAGQPILRLACDDRRATLAARRADADAAAAQARLVAAGPRREDRDAAAARADEARAYRQDAADQLARAEALQGEGFVSKRRLAELRSALAAREAQLVAAQADLAVKQAGSRPDERNSATAVAAAAVAAVATQAAIVEKCALRSPIAGTIVQVFKREGEFSAASTGAPIVVVADLHTMIVRAEIADRDAAAAAPGQRVSVWIDGDKRRWHGRIVRIASLMGRKTARSLDPSDRFDRDIREAIIGFEGAQPPAIVGLRVNIGVLS